MSEEEEELGWVNKVRERREKQGRRKKILLVLAAIILLPLAATGITAYLVNPSFDEFTHWHAEKVRARFEEEITWQIFHPSTASERRKFYDMYIERKSYIFFSLYVSRTEFDSLDRAALPFVVTPARLRPGCFKPSEFLPRGWKPKILYIGLFRSIKEYEKKVE